MPSQPSINDRSASWRTFAIVASVVAIAVAAFAADALFKPFGISGRALVDNLGQLLASVFGSAACAWKATRTVKKERRGWTLLALSAGSWSLGQVAWAYYALVLQVPIPFPSAADVLFLAAAPFTFAGILSFWDAPRGTATRWNVWLDGLIIVLSLVFTEWALDLKTTVISAIQSTAPLTTAYLNPLYLSADIVVATIVILAIRRATHRHKGRMLLVLGGIGAAALSDSTFAYLSANNTYTAGDVIDTGWVVGYAMVALAALWPVSETKTRVRNAPVDMWQLALPLTTVVVAAIVCLGLALSGRSLDGVMTAIVGITSILLTIRVITANRDAVSMLMKSRASEINLAEVIARAPTGFVRINTEFAIIDANPQFSALLAAVDERLVGSPITRYFSAEEGRRFVDLLEALKAGTVNAVDSDSEAHRADGSAVWLHWSATVVRDGAGGRDYFIAMFEDTTARHDSEAAAAASLGLMQRLNSLKTDFLQSVSHEFKTALMGIQGFSELIRDTTELNVDEVRSFAADINRDAERLDRMVTEMLELDRTESGRADLRLAPVDLNALVQREVTLARTWLENVVIELDLDPTLTKVPGDESKLLEVIHTLLANAVTRSPAGGVVTVTTATAPAGVTVGVKDQGVGVRAEFDDRLFDHDDVYADSPIRKLVGTGLGLGIARQVIEMHGGRLWLVRTPQTGSEYHFMLPADSRDRGVAPQQVPMPSAIAS
ncbi:MAG TPA: PAS domain-containing sensor histidine kinase [Candidatus Angelobacter sp.]|nr:PAS domain-containing sensor histidine kinase [Candidatus Angelobacter sp.]